MVFLLRRRGHPSDQIHHRRGLRRLRVRGKRNSEAIVSQLVRRAVAEQRIRTDRRTEAGRKRAPDWGRGGGAAHADQCPEGVFDIILDSSQLGLQIHESMGHPIELDRVLGMEANFAGTSFLTLDKLRHAALRQRPGERRRGRAAGARPRPRHFWVRRRRRSGTVHAYHHQRPVHRISEFPRNRAAIGGIAPAEPCAPKAGTACPSSA